MDLIKALKVAETVLNSGSYSSAARQLGVKPAAVSKQMAELEARIGLRLFERSTRRLRVTDEGRRLLERAAPAVGEIEDAIQASASRSSPQGVVKVSVSAPFARMAVLPQLARFHDQHPDVVVDLRFENRRVDLLAEGYDCAIGVAPPSDSILVARPLISLRPVLCASPTYLARAGVPSRVEDLAGHRCIGLRSETSGALREWRLSVQGRWHSIQPRGCVQLNDPASAATAAEAGCGIVFVGIHHVADGLHSGRLQRLLPEAETDVFDLVVYYTKRRLLPPRTRAFVDFLREVVPQTPALRICRDMLAAET